MEIRTLALATGIAATLALNGIAQAGAFESNALKACAEATAQDSGASRLNVVRYVEHAGRGSYEYWFNADVDPATRSYCRTRHGEVVQFVSFDGRWTSAYALRPRPQAVTLVAPSEAR